MRIDKITLVNQIFYRDKNFMANNENMTLQQSPSSRAEIGLRSRQKARRRDEIIAAAQMLFERQGIDSTTMADIAATAGISTPTVFNYFGSKDGVLIALISEGTMAAREEDRHLHWADDTDLGTLILNLFVRVSGRTLEIADKRVWRYAESAPMRHPETELASQYGNITEALISVVADFFGGLELKTRSGTTATPDFFARLFHDVWAPCFFSLITNADQTLAEHEAELRTRILPLVEMIFDDASISHPIRKGTPE
ncbi:TetR/AcrR family transcriptional regulator [Rhizobium sp. C4]|uniref:TetR/AcrR family transcriptional regulator n=1 Tax=Rhizobium sp. C4 TaxID=1349800 RepID=UPI001E32214A|nr:TetR/AcrR family transcriptional regulator [Rhizobium sp. C4]MCD2174836.1 TetR/AcrR family transcriptional regulator [Rhizobium sp. C4]